jgi:hypothetical protein
MADKYTRYDGTRPNESASMQATVTDMQQQWPGTPPGGVTDEPRAPYLCPTYSLLPVAGFPAEALTRVSRNRIERATRYSRRA